MNGSERRRFLTRTGLLVAGAAVAGSAAAESHGVGKKWGKHSNDFIMPANTESKCATCLFWGGRRHISRDGSEVHVTSLGMCNNPASPNYHHTTSPDTGPMKAWVKWGALGA